jgi:hypothetical protein
MCAWPNKASWKSHLAELDFGNLHQTTQFSRVEAKMDSIFFQRPCKRPPGANQLKFGGAVCLLLLVPVVFGWPLLAQKSNGDANLEFKRLATQLSEARIDGAAENEVLQEKAISYLDALASVALSNSDAPDLDVINQRLASLVSRDPPVGENYRLLRLGGNPATYALVANFGLGGPAAVRVYTGTGNRYALAAKIDHFVQPDFFDSDIELIPISGAEPAFVIVAGRTDDLATGVFSAWRFDGRGAVMLWTSDLLQQSSYQADANGFHLTYCSQPDDDHPAICPKMARDLYRLEAREWKRIESTSLGPAEPAKK